MMTKKEVADLIETNTYREELLESGLGWAIMEARSRKRFYDAGFMGSFGDSFSYKRGGVICFGDCNNHSERIAQRFSKKYGSEILTKLDIVMFDPENRGQLEIYKEIDDETRFANKDNIVELYADHLTNNRGYPVRLLVHIDDEHYLRTGFFKPKMKRMGGTFSLPRGMGIEDSMLKDAAVIEVGIRGFMDFKGDHFILHEDAQEAFYDKIEEKICSFL